MKRSCKELLMNSFVGGVVVVVVEWNPRVGNIQRESGRRWIEGN